MDEYFKKNTLHRHNLFFSMKLFRDRIMRKRITKLGEHISLCWVFLYSVSKDWKTTYKINSPGQNNTISAKKLQEFLLLLTPLWWCIKS